MNSSSLSAAQLHALAGLPASLRASFTALCNMGCDVRYAYAFVMAR